MDNSYFNQENNHTSVFPIRPWQITSYSVISFTGIVGNLLVLSVVSKNSQIRSSSFGVYLSSLAIADLFVAILCIPVYVTSTSNFTTHPSGVAGDAMCKILTGYNILFLFATVSVYTLVAIAYERYYAICNPLSSRAVATPQRAKHVVVIIWIFSLIIGINSIYGEQYAHGEDAEVGAHCKFSINYNSHITPKLIYLFTFSVQYVFPVLCMLYCFLRIHGELTKQNQLLIKNQTGKPQPAVVKQFQQRRSTIRTVILVVSVYFLLWTPNQLLYLCFNFNLFSTSWNSTLVQCSVVLCFLTCCINPVIYSFRSEMFRDGFKETFGCARWLADRRTRAKRYSTLDEESCSV